MAVVVCNDDVTVKAIEVIPPIYVDSKKYLEQGPEKKPVYQESKGEG
jgi:hypothetical protein